MTITPDTKDWTWVLNQPCPECGFDSRTITGRDVPALLRFNVAEWPAVLADPAVRDRRRPDAWSPLEYACHVRDVFRIYTYRLGLILTEDDPLFPNWDQDETAVAERYGEQEPGTVSAELVAAGEALADAFEAVPDDAWQRTGNRSDGAHFTVETFARYFVHDPIHHLHDVRTS
ncbi:DinB family protein [Virgisporangium ochraceum]|uniref:DinB-like domain-containing protein n=1 Tax=Virgisporangium ochraceum TaxID=65505 RepID=A0A8J3ZMD8_9ACTN|nr:DinB family protein [Virgisporangium ochraceum]GIJ65463.1 hypothetical protein Voc01_003800 [Virgisporangium ochraceum]